MTEPLYRPWDQVSIALLEHLGVDPQYVTEVTYHHHVSGLPTVTVEMFALGSEGEFIIRDDERVTQTVHYEWRPIIKEPAP